MIKPAPRDDQQLSAGAVWRRERDRYRIWNELRNQPELTFHWETGYEAFAAGPGYWSAVTYDDVRFISRHPERFCSGKGSNIPDLPIEIAEFYGSMINMDSPRHTRLRLIVNRSFTTRQVAKIDADVEDRAAAIARRACELGEFDFVAEVAARLPLQIICEMMGIPPSQWDLVFHHTNVILGVGDPEYVSSFDDVFRVSLELAAIAEELANDRLANPRDDLTTSLMHAEVDGERLTTSELASFFILLVVAGGETTRNAITHAMWQLTVDEGQRRLWAERYDDVNASAVEETVRFATPVIHFRRTATQDTYLRDQLIQAGDKVVMWLASANRDPAAFNDPDRFDIQRDPNEHVGFGAGGPHFCLGANLARREISAMMREVLRIPGLEVTGEPRYLESQFINGIKALPCRVR